MTNMKYYKLLSQEMTSFNDTKWKLNEKITVDKPGNKMCSDQVLHCYNHPLLAVIFNPIHGYIKNPLLFEIEVDEIVNSDGCKFASKSQTLLEEIPLPEISLDQRVEFGIRVSKLVCKNEKWNFWADRWLSGEDRSRESAKAAAYAAANAAQPPAAVYAAYAAYYVSDAANYAASAASNVASYASGAAYYAAVASYAANAAVYYAANDKNEFNEKMIDIIENIVKMND